MGIIMNGNSTPINQIQNNQQFGGNQNDNLVNDILKEIDQTSTNQPMSNEDIGSKQAQYQMDPVHQQQPSQQQQQQPPPQQQYIDENAMDPQMMQQQMMQEQMMQQQMNSQMDQGNMGYDMGGGPPKTLVEKILEESKGPGIVALLFIALSFKQFDGQIIKFIPKALNATGEITNIGIIIKGLMAGLLF